MIRTWPLIALAALAFGGAAHAQSDEGLPTAPVGQTAQSSSGQVGTRLTRELTSANTNPMQRISSRIQNRVPSRIQNRLDRFYEPDVATTERFGAATTEVQSVNRPRAR